MAHQAGCDYGDGHGKYQQPQDGDDSPRPPPPDYEMVQPVLDPLQQGRIGLTLVRRHRHNIVHSMVDQSPPVAAVPLEARYRTEYRRSLMVKAEMAAGNSSDPAMANGTV